MRGKGLLQKPIVGSPVLIAGSPQVSPEKIPEDRPFPFPMQPQMPSMPGAGKTWR